MVRGVRWLGTTSRIVTFSSEKQGDGFRNSLLLTDVRSRASVPFREVTCLPRVLQSQLLASCFQCYEQSTYCVITYCLHDN